MSDFLIGVVGDFSGSGREAGEGRFRDVDRDEFDEVFARLSPRVSTGLPFCPEVVLASWEDFHPDALADRVPALSKLLDARGEVSNPRLMRRLIEEAGVDLEAVDAAGGGAAATGAPPAAPERPPERVSEGELLDSILEGGGAAGPVKLAPTRASADPEFERVIAEIVAASSDSTDYAQQDRWREAIDREIAARMRALLHAPTFQRLEASWRSLRSLVMGLETGASLRIQVLDLSSEVLLDELGSGARSALLDRLVVDLPASPGGTPFGVLACDYALGSGDADTRILTALADVAGRARVPVVAGLSPGLWAGGELDWAGLEQVAAGLRGVAGSERLGLVLPRLLLRLPYGAETDAVDRFAFEEKPAPGPAQYVWGNGAYAVAFAAGEAVTSLGRAVAVAKFAQLDGLPFHAARHGVEVEPVGPTDRPLSDAEIERAADLGLVPLAGFRGQDRAFLARLQALSGDGLFPA